MMMLLLMVDVLMMENEDPYNISSPLTSICQWVTGMLQ